MASPFTHVTIPSSPTATAIVVSNIAPEATETTVLDFFRFCGEIAQFELVKVTDQANNESKKAFIQFEKEAAARTALLLSNTMIMDRPIEIALYFDNLPPYAPTDEEDLLSADNAPPTITVPQESKPKSNVIAEMIAQGYKIGEQIAQDARKFDETYGITNRFQQFLQNAKAKGVEVDQKYQISAKGHQAIESATKKVQGIYHDIDSKYQVNQKLDGFASAGYNAVQDFDHKYHVKTKFDEVASAASQLGQQAMGSDAAKRVNSMLHQLAESAIKTLEEAKVVLNTEIEKARAEGTAGTTANAPEADQASASAQGEGDATASAAEPPAYQDGEGAPADDTKVPPS